MTQKELKKVAALMMGMSWKGWSASKSGSPVMIALVGHDKASSKNLLSVLSRLADTCCVIVINWLRFSKAAIILKRASVDLVPIELRTHEYGCEFVHSSC